MLLIPLPFNFNIGNMLFMIGIVDYGAGNVSSVERALAAIGFLSVMTDSTAALQKCSALIVPGVGEASYAMERLGRKGLDAFIKEWATAKKPVMGICLGSQIIFEHSDEGDTKCLGLVAGNVRHFFDVWKESGIGFASLKVPHIGWNNLVMSNGGTPLLQNTEADYYFVHSFVMCPENKNVVKAYTDYGTLVPAVVECGSVCAFQFHPEKSGAAGLEILRRFCTAHDEPSSPSPCTDKTNGGALC